MGAASQVSFGAGVGGMDTYYFTFETEYVGDGVHTRRYDQPERLCGPEVHDKLEFGRQFDRQRPLLGRSEQFYTDLLKY
jgi:hypothetical protein